MGLFHQDQNMRRIEARKIICIVKRKTENLLDRNSVTGGGAKRTGWWTCDRSRNVPCSAGGITALRAGRRGWNGRERQGRKTTERSRARLRGKEKSVVMKRKGRGVAGGWPGARGRNISKMCIAIRGGLDYRNMLCCI